MMEIAKLFIIIYASIKDVLPLEVTDDKSVYYVLARKLITILLSVLLLLIIYAILLPFAFLRLCIHLILSILHGESYGGLLSGLDSLFEMNPNKTVINVINIYSSKDDPAISTDKLKGIVSEIYASSFKFSSHIRSVLGYCYFVKDQVDLEEIVEVIRYNNDEYMSKEMLHNYLEENCLTLKRNQMWKVVIFEQPILWSQDGRGDEDNMKQYAIVWTLRHSLGDGPSIITIFQKYAIQEGSGRLVDAKKFEKIRDSAGKITLDNVRVRRNIATTKLDGLSLKIDGNSKWYSASFVESEPKYVAVIKRIKDEMKASFTEVISAAITASVGEYIKQRNVTLDNFTIAKVIRLKSEDLLKLKNGTYKFEEIKNNFGLVAAQLPPTGFEGRNMKDTVRYLRRYNESLLCAVDPFVAYVFLNSICTYLPIGLTRTSCTSFMDSMTIGVTNLVGFRRSTLCDYVIDDIFFFTPGFLNTAFIFSIFSYDGRLQIVLSSREGFVNNRQELQRILDNVFTYIGKAQEEISTDLL